MKRRIWIWFLVLILVYLQYRLWFSGHGLLYLWSLEEDIAKQTLSNQKSKKCNEILSNEVIYFRQNKDALEERARYELNMIKKNELFISIDDTYKPNSKETECDILE